MRNFPSLCACLAVLSLLPAGSGALAVEAQDALVVSVQDASAKVGEKATVVARVTPREGYKIAENYRNRISSFSAEDQGVDFAKTVVQGQIENDSLLFKIPVTPRTPGVHVINAVLRLGFVNSIDGDYHLDIKSVPVVATVTGTE
jgi:hypothetical protein